MKKIKDRYMEAARFILAGAISFAVDFCILIVLQEFLGLKNYPNGIVISTALAYLIALVVHYLLSVFWVFRGHKVKSGIEHLKAGGLFSVTYGVGFLLTEFGMWLGVSVFGWSYLYVKVVVTGLVMIWNYMIQKLFVFRQRKQHHQVADL